MVSNKISRKDVRTCSPYVQKTIVRPRIKLQQKVDVKKAFYELLFGLKQRFIWYKNDVNNKIVRFIRSTFLKDHPHQYMFERLPYEMLLMILHNLPLEALRSLACASKYLCSVLQHYYLSQVFRRRFDVFAVADFGSFLVRVFIDRC